MNGCCSIVIFVSLIAYGDNITPAIAELRKLGATVSLDADEVRYVHIDSKWEGGDDGIAHIERLPYFEILLITGRPKISEERLAKLKETLPGLRIQRRGNAYLGVSGDDDFISGVFPGSPAAKAGLAKGDTLDQVEGKKIENFDKLVNELLQKEPGDEIAIGILRRGQPIIVRVRLKKWPVELGDPVRRIPAVNPADAEKPSNVPSN